MSLPWRTDKKPRYVEQERREGKRAGTRQQLNSGRLWSSLGDAVAKVPGLALMIDNKTGRDGPLNSYRITREGWKLMRKQARRTPPGCAPCLKLNIGEFHLMVIDEQTWDARERMLDEALRKLAEMSDLSKTDQTISP